tara:strand:+ start:2447 stop:3457 length:1011 start_codon:yes stop_codon:yes gene_type:complete
MQKNILLINLGSPKSLDIKDVREYLKEFLSDDLVIDLPKPIQQFILRYFILPFRPLSTKAAYEIIWDKEGSPLISNSKKIATALKNTTGWNVDIAMRYQEPSIKDYIIKCKNSGIRDVYIVPLYPHHAISTTLSTRLFVKNIVEKFYPDMNLKFTEPFFDHPQYVKALSNSIKPYLQNIDKLIFSYHGIPERHIRKGDISSSHCLKNTNCCNVKCDSSRNCYKSNVLTTSNLCAERLQLDRARWMVSFQSRVSIIDPNWLKPYSDKEFFKLPKKGVKKVAVVCPSFVADCLETLEEINIRGRKTFLDAGGIDFQFIPCLNDSPEFILALESVINNI